MFWKVLLRAITKIFSHSSTVRMPVEVLDDDDLLRRVPFADPSYVRDDLTLSSFAFKPKRNDANGLSVDLSKLTTYEKSIFDRSRFRLYSIKAGSVRQIDLNCKHDPKEDNLAHTLIVGKISNSTAKKLSQRALRVPYPD